VVRKNSKGEIINGKAEYRDNAYYTVLPNGEFKTDYKSFASPDADEFGFDRSNKEPNGDYSMEVILPKGSVIIRYGSPFGRYTAPKGTKFEELALPFTEESCEYNEYRVLDDISVQCKVIRGRVAPNFRQRGGGVQYVHHNTIKQEIEEKKLERIIL